MTFDDFRACIDARISSAYGLDEADLYLITEELQKLDIRGVRELIRDITKRDPFAATCLLNDLADFFVITSRSFTASAATHASSTTCWSPQWRTSRPHRSSRSTCSRRPR